jgi:hypothetical protein
MYALLSPFWFLLRALAIFLIVLSKLVGMPEGKRRIGKPRGRGADNIKMDPVDIGWGDVDWSGSG